MEAQEVVLGQTESADSAVWMKRSALPLVFGVARLVQGIESPHPDSTARAICGVCDARLRGSLADEVLLNASIKSWGELSDQTAETLTELGINSIHP